MFNSINDIIIPELIRRKDECDAIFNHLYSKDEILSELYIATQIISPFPKCIEMPMITNEWHFCNIFGYRYTHGLLRKISNEDIKAFLKKYGLSGENFGRVKGKKCIFNITPMDVLNTKSSFHYSYLKPRQDELFERWKKKYLSTDIIASLLAFDVDPTKFWYVLLWMKDYVESKLESVHKYYTPVIDSMKDICETIQTNLTQHYRLENYTEEDPKFKLTLSTKDHIVVVKHPGFMKILSESLLKFIDEYNSDGIKEECNYIDPEIWYYVNEDFCFENTEETLSMVGRNNYKLFLFHDVMQKYLRTKRGAKNMMMSDLIAGCSSNELVRVDKEWLISKLAIVIGYIEEADFKSDEHCVKSRIKGIKADIFNTMYSNRYRYG